MFPLFSSGYMYNIVIMLGSNSYQYNYKHLTGCCGILVLHFYSCTCFHFPFFFFLLFIYFLFNMRPVYYKIVLRLQLIPFYCRFFLRWGFFQHLQTLIYIYIFFVLGNFYGLMTTIAKTTANCTYNNIVVVSLRK